MDHSVDDRRRETRFAQNPGVALQATLRPGCPVAVVDVSAGGVLVEAARPLRPGAKVHLQVVTPADRWSIGAHVLRCTVWAVDPHHGVRYRGALRFEQPCDGLRVAVTLEGSPVPLRAGGEAPPHGQALPASYGAIPAAARRRPK